METPHTLAHSFGIIPIYTDYNGYKVLVVQNSNGGHWGFPKGTPEKDETPMQTAVRELQEETGITEKDIRIQTEPTITEQYSFEQKGTIYDKTNTYYIGFVDGMTIGTNLDEITEGRWVLLSEAEELFVNASALDTLQQVADYVESLDEYNW